MKNVFDKWRKDLKKELKAHTWLYVFTSIILLSAFFVRVYRADQLIGFYYDQGRDALVIWRLINEGKPFLIGPVTGLSGIFLGPLYYYIIAPFYLLGGGNPVVPAVFLAFLTTLALVIVYYLGWKFHSRATGLIAVTIGAFSYYIVLAGRWLSNPTSILLTSVILLWMMWRVLDGNKKDFRDKKGFVIEWIIIALLVGISLQFEAASAIFYIPMIVVFLLWQRRKIPNIKTIIFSSAVFLFTFIPQIAFNFRHNNLLFDNFIKVLFEDKSFRANFWVVLNDRLNFFWTVFNSKIFPEQPLRVALFTTIVLLALLLLKKSKITKKAIALMVVFVTPALIGFIAFQGNFGNIYDYYLTGYYLPLILLFSLGLGLLWDKKWGKIIVIVFFIVFFMRNGILVKNKIIAGVDGPTHISLGNEMQAVDWVFTDAQGRGNFNVDVYVPPVIPHSYDYLFLWQKEKRCEQDRCTLVEERVPVLYTLYEVDPPHPERLEAWLERQKGIGIVEEEASFGGVTVQRRERIVYED